MFVGEEGIRGLDLELKRGRVSLKLWGENHLWGLEVETKAVAMEVSQSVFVCVVYGNIEMCVD